MHDADIAGSMRKRRMLAVAVAGVLLVAGCGGGDDDEDAGRTTTVAPEETTTAPAPSTSAAPPTTDQAKVARAQAAVLQQGDLPAGFNAQPPDEGLFIDQLWPDLLRCVGVPDPQLAATATSPTFVRGIATQARTRVDYMTQEAADAIAAALQGPKAQQCLTEVFTADAERSKPEGATPGPSQVRPLQVPQVGQRTLAWRVEVTMNLEDLPVPIFQDFLVVFDDDGAVIPMFFLNPGGEFPPDLERSLVQKVASRA